MLVFCCTYIWLWNYDLFIRFWWCWWSAWSFWPSSTNLAEWSRDVIAVTMAIWVKAIAAVGDARCAGQVWRFISPLTAFSPIRDAWRKIYWLTQWPKKLIAFNKINLNKHRSKLGKKRMSNGREGERRRPITFRESLEKGSRLCHTSAWHIRIVTYFGSVDVCPMNHNVIRPLHL